MASHETEFPTYELDSLGAILVTPNNGCLSTYNIERVNKWNLRGRKEALELVIDECDDYVTYWLLNPDLSNIEYVIELGDVDDED